MAAASETLSGPTSFFYTPSILARNLNVLFFVSSSSSRMSQLSGSAITMGLLVAIIGFTSSFAIVLAGFRAAGASDAQAASGLMALSIGMGLSGIWLSLRHRMPISAAWSTPGAALLISSGSVLASYEAAVGAFVVSGILLMLAGWLKPLGRAIEAIPSSLANAMLAGILLGICLSPVKAMAFDPWLAAPLILAWWLVGQINRLAAVPAALLALVAMAIWKIGLPEDLGTQLSESLIPQAVFIIPHFELGAMISIGVPLFVVTMASQNIPGISVLRANGYTPPSGPLIANTGVFSTLSAFFGAHAVNLAAITAAMCAGPDAHPDTERRYWAAVVAGLGYVAFGLLAGIIGLLVTLVPTILIEAIAGLALIGALTSSLVAAFSNTDEREAAAVTFLLSGSGVAFLGIGGAFWGLLAGALMVFVTRRIRKS